MQHVLDKMPEVLPSHMRVDDEFAAIWEQNNMDGHQIVADAMADIEQSRGVIGETETVYFTDVTLRDGQQQETDPVTTEQRLAVFKKIVETGVDRIEIGHLGNEAADQELAHHIVQEVAAQEKAGDSRYADVKLQVLFGSDKQEAQTKAGIAVLQKAFQTAYGEDWQEKMSDKVVVHVYDRIDPNLTRVSKNPYDARKSAHQVANSAQFALDAGFTQFSVSAEAATAVTVEEMIQFYRSVNQRLFDRGAKSVNNNLANTYGFSADTSTDAAAFAVFNRGVKAGFPEGAVTTSIHTHNDRGSATDVSMRAITGGFDRVEGTHIGMGEREGNVALVEVMGRMLERAVRPEEITEVVSGVAAWAGKSAVRRSVAITPEVAQHVHHWYDTAEFIADVFGPQARKRWHKTSLGSPNAHDNGSGPHDQLMKAAVEDPVNYPPYQAYEWTLGPNGAMGRTEADDIAIGDPDAVIKVTVANHAGGGSTSAIVNGDFVRAAPDVIEKARDMFRNHKAELIGRVATGIVVSA